MPEAQAWLCLLDRISRALTAGGVVATFAVITAVATAITAAAVAAAATFVAFAIRVVEASSTSCGFRSGGCIELGFVV